MTISTFSSSWRLLQELHSKLPLPHCKAQAVGEEIIQMLAALEDFQKKLWLKKKFVVQSDYCITLDRVPESLYEEICANEEQHEEWKRLFDIESIKATEGDMFSSGKQGYTEAVRHIVRQYSPCSPRVYI